MAKKKAAKPRSRQPTLKTLIKRIVQRCDDHDIKVEQSVDDDGDDRVTLHLPNGREQRVISFWDKDEISAFLAIEFHRFTFVGDYMAIACHEDETIEALVQSITPMSSRLIPRFFGGDAESDDVEIEISADDSDASITFGKATETLTTIGEIPQSVSYTHLTLPTKA